MSDTNRDVCDRIAEKIAGGEVLSDGERGHIDGCAVCGATRRAADRVREALTSRASGPPVGFDARVTARAAARMHGRRRMFAIVSGGAAVAAAALIVVVLARGDDRPRPTREDRAAGGEAVRVDAPLIGSLVEISDVDFALRDGARWGWVEEPIAEMHMFAPDLREMKGGPR